MKQSMKLKRNPWLSHRC